MIKVYKQELLDFLDTLPVHQRSNNVRVMRAPATTREHRLIPLLLKHNFCHAVMAPSPNIVEIRAKQAELNPAHWAKDINLHTHTLDRNYPFGDPNYRFHTNLGRDEPDFMGTHFPDLVQRERLALEEYFKTATAMPMNKHSKTPEVQCRVFHAKPGCDRDGFAPVLHSDFGLSAYTAFFGAPMQWMPLDNDIDTSEDPNQYLESLGSGWQVIYNGEFRHRSSLDIPRIGQLAMDLYCEFYPEELTDDPIDYYYEEPAAIAA